MERFGPCWTRVLSRFTHPKPYFGLMWAKTVLWPYLGLRGSNLNSEGTFPSCNPQLFCGVHPSEWPKHAPRPECWLLPVHLAPLWEPHEAYHGSFPAILSHFAYSKPHFGRIVPQNRALAIFWATWLKLKFGRHFSKEPSPLFVVSTPHNGRNAPLDVGPFWI